MIFFPIKGAITQRDTLLGHIAATCSKGEGGGGGGGGWGGHAMSHPGYLHGPLQMFGPGNGVCNYLALEKIYGMLILQIRA